MKPIGLLAAAFVLSLALVPAPAEITSVVTAQGTGSREISGEGRSGHCSAVCVTNDGYPVFGANMDYALVEDGLVFIKKRGVTHTGLWPGTRGENAVWTSRYASITFGLVGFPYAWAGMNEAGLTFSTMALPNETEPPPADERPALDSGVWIQYLLDTCATLQEVIAAESAVRVYTADHYLMADRQGNCAALEFLDGEMVVYAGANLPVRVLTNTPYRQLTDAWEWLNRYGSYPTRNTSIRRFLIGAESISGFESRSIDDAVHHVFETLWAMRGERFSQHTSQWSIVFDTKRLRVHFRTASHPDIRTVALAGFDPSCQRGVRMLQIQADLSGDVTRSFGELSFEASVDQMEEFVSNWGYTHPRSYYEDLTRHFMDSPCNHSPLPRRHRRPVGRLGRE